MNVSDSPAAPDWWQASDGKWYPPESHPDAQQPPSIAVPAEDTGRKPMRHVWWAVALLVVVALIVVRVAANFAGDDPVASEETAVATQPVATEPFVEGPAEPAVGDEAETSQECSYQGVGDSGRMLVRLEFASPLATQTDLLVRYGLFDSTGERFDTANQVVNSAVPGQPMRLESDTLDELPDDLADDDGITCVISQIRELEFEDTPQRPGPSDVCRVLGVNSFGSLQLEFTITSPFAVLVENMFIPYSLSVDGVRYDDALHSIRDVRPGETVTSLADSIVKSPAWADELPTCQILELDDL